MQRIIQPIRHKKDRTWCDLARKNSLISEQNSNIHLIYGHFGETAKIETRLWNEQELARTISASLVHIL